MTFNEQPPKSLRWLDTSAARAATTALAIIAIAGATVLGVRQQAYVTCVAKQQAADQRRTAAIAEATDVERAAQRKLLAEVTPGNAAALRAAVLAAYDATDRVRAANPPATSHRC